MPSRYLDPYQQVTFRIPSSSVRSAPLPSAQRKKRRTQISPTRLTKNSAADVEDAYIPGHNETELGANSVAVALSEEAIMLALGAAAEVDAASASAHSELVPPLDETGATNTDAELEPAINEFYTDVDEVPEPGVGSTSQPVPSPIAISEDTLNLESQYLFDQSEPDILASEISRRLEDDLVLLLGIWCEKYFVSRKAWSALREILLSVCHIDSFSQLPAKLDTIKRRSRSQLPGFNIRHKKINTSSQKQPSKAKNRASSHVSPSSTGNLYWFDPEELVTAMLSAESINAKSHKGMAEIVDVPIELWHFPCWGGSIRSTSGEFARYRESLRPVFPSDFAEFQCDNDSCLCNGDAARLHLGRVIFVGRDKRGKSRTAGIVLLTMQLISRFEQLTPSNQLLVTSSGVPPYGAELFLLEDVTIVAPESKVVRQVQNIQIDREFDSTVTLTAPADNILILRRIIKQQDYSIRAFRYMAPIRAELEIETFGRVFMEENFAGHIPVKSVPFLLFIDGFGVHRNTYRSMTGIYWHPAALTYQERNRIRNVFPLTLAPHGSELKDVIYTMGGPLATLDRGKIMAIKGVDHFVCAYTMVVIGDMPQQHDNSGFLRQSAVYGCNLCLCHKDNRGDLAFDTVLKGRYHHSTIRYRERASKMASGPRKTFLSSAGMGLTPSPLVDICPALDLILTRAPDAPHSDFQGLTRLMQELLVDTILSRSGAIQYTKHFQAFPMRPGWNRLQSPLHYIFSWSLSEAGRASFHTAIVLRSKLQASWIKPKFLDAVSTVFKKEMQQHHLTATETIMWCYARMAHSNAVVGSPSLSASDRKNFNNIILLGRRVMQGLLKCADNSNITLKYGFSTHKRLQPNSTTRQSNLSHSPAAVTHHQDSISDVNTSSESEPQRQEHHRLHQSITDASLEFCGDGTAVTVQYSRLMRLPNMHQALHFPSFITEYGSMANVNVLMGEAEHKLFKAKADRTTAHSLERQLVLMASWYASFRFGFAGAWNNTQPELMNKLYQLRSSCPNLFDNFVPRSEQDEILIPQSDVMDDELHRGSVALVRVSDAYFKRYTNMPTATENNSPSNSFFSLLRRAYARDLNQPDRMDLHKGKLEWFARLSFTDPISERRVTFKLDDYAQVYGGQLVKINYIFVHQLDERRAFAVVRPLIDAGGGVDRILGLPIVFQTQDHRIIGLSAFEGQRPYIVDIGHDSRAPAATTGIDPVELGQIERQEKEPPVLVHCNWDLRFL